MASSSSSKTLLRTSLSLLNRLTITTPKLLSPPLPPPPPFLPFLNNLQITPNDEEASVTKLCSEGFLYPTGLPYIPFLLPEGEDSSSSEPILFHPKRTYQPSIIRRKRNHGFFARKATVGGRRVIKRRIAKGRYRITA